MGGSSSKEEIEIKTLKEELQKLDPVSSKQIVIEKRVRLAELEHILYSRQYGSQDSFNYEHEYAQIAAEYNTPAERIDKNKKVKASQAARNQALANKQAAAQQAAANAQRAANKASNRQIKKELLKDKSVVFMKTIINKNLLACSTLEKTDAQKYQAIKDLIIELNPTQIQNPLQQGGKRRTKRRTRRA